MYHSVGEPYPSGASFPPAEFRRHLSYLTERFEIVDLPTVLDVASADQPRVALTFDGGYANFYDRALPVLREFDAPATVFVIPERIGRRNPDPASTLWMEWFDFMTGPQLRELVADPLITLGNKTLDHRRVLPAIRSHEEVVTQVRGGKRRLEREFDTSVSRFCYPSGRFDGESRAVVRDCHEYAVTTCPRFVRDDIDPTLVPRWDADLIDADTLGRRLTRTNEWRVRLRDRLDRTLGVA